MKEKQLEEHLQEQIITYIEHVLVACRDDRTKAQQLFDLVKNGRFGRDPFEKIYGAEDFDLLDSLDSIARYYESPTRILKTMLGSAMPSDQEVRKVLDDIINSTIKLYRPENLENNNNNNNTVASISSNNNTNNINNNFNNNINDSANDRLPDKHALMHQIRTKLCELNSEICKKDINLNENIERLCQEIMRLKEQAGIINTGDRDYFGILNLSNLDLSNLDLQNLNFKLMHFTNSNLSNTNLSNASLARCIFDNCNLQNTNFSNASMIGENVSFKNANVRGANFIGITIEKGTSWDQLQNPDEIKEEIISRGALNTNEAIFIPPMLNQSTQRQTVQLQREWASRTQTSSLSFSYNKEKEENLSGQNSSTLFSNSQTQAKSSPQNNVQKSLGKRDNPNTSNNNLAPKSEKKDSCLVM